MPKKKKHPSPSLADHPASSAGNDTVCRTSSEVALDKHLSKRQTDSKNDDDVASTYAEPFSSQGDNPNTPGLTHGDATMEANQIPCSAQHKFPSSVPSDATGVDVDDNRTLLDLSDANSAHDPSCAHGTTKDAAVTWSSIRELEQNVFQRVLAEATDQMQNMIDGNFDIYNAHGLCTQNIPSCSCRLPSICQLDAAA